MPQAALKVQLLSYTPQPEHQVALAAKLCYSKDDLDTLSQGIAQKDQAKYLERLVEMGHMSPIEHVSFTFGVEGVSRSLLAQLTRHRLASFSVQSQRYVRAGGEDGFQYVLPPAIAALGEQAIADFEAQMQQMQAWYDDWNRRLGESGESSNEDARFVLPNAAATRLILTMNARELQHFLRLRCCNRAQWEIRAMSWEMLRQLVMVAPHLFATAGPGCVGGPCPEKGMTCGKLQQVRARHAQMMNGGNI